MKMEFYNYRINLKQDAKDIEVKTEDDWNEPRWFDIAELNDSNLSEPTRDTLVSTSIIRE